MNTALQARKDRHFALSPQLAQLDSARLGQLLGDTGPRRGWGATHVLKVGGEKVFVKRVPVTQRERDSLYSTRNLYNLPLFYNYGVGSAGFGAFRELVAHIKTTGWVLTGAETHFPLLYHYRIVPATPGPGVDEERHAGYVKYWASDPNIDRYIRERSVAPYEMVLFLEHVPHVLYRWLEKNLDRWEPIETGMRQAIAHLRAQGIVHFDAHFGNILVDDDGQPYLTDYGLVLDKTFDLTGPEKAFLNRHLDYDFAEFLAGAGFQLGGLYRNLPAGKKARLARRLGLADDADWDTTVAALLDHVDALPAPESYRAAVTRLKGFTLTMNDFFGRLRQNDAKRARFPAADIAQLLEQALVR